jgi:hypothetical protein
MLINKACVLNIHIDTILKWFNILNLGSVMLHAISDNMECGMWDDE